LARLAAFPQPAGLRTLPLAAGPRREPQEFHSGRLPPPPGQEAGELAAWKALALARFLHHQNHDAGPATAALRCVWLGRLLDFSWRSPRRALFFDFSDHTLMEFCAAQVASPPPSAAERHRVLQALDAAGAAIGFFAAQGQIRPEHAEIWLRITGHLSSQVQQWKTG
jgi:hypothetical protein